MKKILLVSLFFLILTPLGFSTARGNGEGSQDLQQYLESEVSSAEAGFNQEPVAEDVRDPQDVWYLRRIWLRLRPHIGFNLVVVSVKVIPEVELLWERPYPDGWVTYKK